MPQSYHQHLFRPRAVSDLAQERICPAHPANREEANLVADVPSIYELMDQYKTPEATRRVANVLLAPAVFGRPMVASPGIPPDRVKILRDAYHQSLKDPALLEELKKRRWAVDAIGGEELAKLAKEVVSQPPDVVDRMMKLLGN